MKDKEIIEKVKACPEIYDKSHPAYKNQCRKMKFWMEISQELGIDAKKRWNYLRDRFVKEKRRIGDGSRPASAGYPRWAHYDSLLFLNEHLKESLRTYYDPIERAESSTEGQQYSIKHENEGFVEDYDVLYGNDQTNLSQAVSPSPYFVTTTTEQRMHYEDDAYTESMQEMKTRMRLEEDDDEDKLFAKFLATQMKKMTEQQKYLFRIKTQELAQQAILEQLT